MAFLPAASLGDRETRSKMPYAARPVRGTLVALGIAAAFAALVGLRLHGFSLAAWHEVIDGSPARELVAGTPRPIRSDDWKVQLPLAFAQAAHDPPFPSVNRLVGAGQSALVPIELPVAHPLVLFRPTVWGFFLGADVGMAWMWWSRAFALALTWFAVLRLVTRGSVGLATAGAAGLLVSPFFQFWSLNAAPHTAAAGASFLATVALARARTPARIAASGLALALAGAWFALALYPPYQVVLGLLYLALVAAFWRDARPALDLRRHAAARGAALAAAALAAAALAGWFAFEARDALAAMRYSEYPGHRSETGGDRSLWQLANANLAAGLWATDWGPLYNVCEAASFWLLSPPLLALWAWRRLRGRGRDPFVPPLALLGGVLLAYVVLGFPEWLARATALSLVPGRRAVIGLGLVDAVLALRLLACAAPAAGRERRVAALAAAGWACALAGCAPPLGEALAGARMPLLLALAAANGALAWLALAGRRRVLPALAWVAASGASALWFNPLAAGGADYLRENELARRVLAVEAATPGGATWAAFGRDDLANLFRALGVRSVNGTLTQPQPALWERLAPPPAARPVYDRYAHFAFVARPGAKVRFRLRSQDFVVVELDPRGPALRALGVTHVLLYGAESARAAFERLSGFEPLGSVGDHHLYRVPDGPPHASRP
jgi:hypothetical protein